MNISRGSINPPKVIPAMIRAEPGLTDHQQPPNGMNRANTSDMMIMVVTLSGLEDESKLKPVA